jgi:CDGSH iron-sulfur domain-containing protein 3
MNNPEICKSKSIEMFMPTGLYRWCACGHSSTEPFCDDSHYGTGVEPMNVRLDEEKIVAWCGCKKSSMNPFCDGITNEHKGMKLD